MNVSVGNQPHVAATLLMELKGVTKVYGSGPAAVHALAGVDLRIDNKI